MSGPQSGRYRVGHRRRRPVSVQSHEPRAITKRSAIRLTTGLLGLLAGACNSSPPQATPAPTLRPEKRRNVPAPPRPVAGTITIGIGSDAQTLQPLLARDTASAAYIATHYNAPLMRRNPETLDWDPTYGTAAGVVIGDQGRTLRFTLKPGLQWSDGKPLTVHDYRYTYARMSDPSTGYPYRDLFRPFEAVTTPDDETLELTLREPFCPALDYAVLNPIPQHVFGDAPLDAHPASTKPTVGSGAWILSSWTRDQEAVFVANDRFYLGRPPTDRLVFRLARDADAALALLQTGEIDHAVLQASNWDEARVHRVSARSGITRRRPRGRISGSTFADLCCLTSASGGHSHTRSTGHAWSRQSARDTPD